MSKGPKIVAIVFVALGALGFLLATGFFTNLSETALIGGAFALISGLAGAGGAFLGSNSTGKAIGLALLMAILVNVALISFFQIIWPML
ncbi:MAG: hypothetical protein KDK23_06115 [Leptospiraceae bacterium]|nr:hypothetical protein [Leptospiraceae bacterium]